jgi:hypothetical protein
MIDIIIYTNKIRMAINIKIIFINFINVESYKEWVTKAITPKLIVLKIKSSFIAILY